MKRKYYITYSYFDTKEDEDNDILSYAWDVFEVNNYQEAIESIYYAVETTHGKIMAAIYSMNIE